MAGFEFDVRDMIRGPFVLCSGCRNETLGVIHVGPRHVGRRCRTCLRNETAELPELTKQVVYLDQFVISEIMKALDPEAPSHSQSAPRWSEVFSLLDRLVKLQLVVCPDSSAHRDESAVHAVPRKLRRVYELLSNGVTFDNFGLIRNRQILALFESWLDGKEPPGPGEATQVTTGDLHGWSDTIRVSVDLGLDFSDDLRRAREEKADALGVHGVWKRSPRGFEEQYEAELSAWRRDQIDAWNRYVSSWRAVHDGAPVEDLESLVPPAPVRLIREMMDLSLERKVPPEQLNATIGEFIRTSDLSKVPSIHLAAMLLASLAREAPKRNPPNRGTVADFNVVSCLLPYCDAMFLDKGTAALLRNEPLRTEVASYDCRIFSLSNVDELIAHLEAIEELADPEHLRLVEDVYGPTVGEPFLELFTYDQPPPDDVSA